MKHSIKRNSGKFSTLTLILLAVCIFSRSSEAQTSIYIFDSYQSTVVQTGGIAGVHETYPVNGLFQLTVDVNTGTASFDYVEAFLLSPVSSAEPEQLGELFNMTDLAGTVVDDMKIDFQGKTADDTNTDIHIQLTLTDNSVYLSGQTIPPPESADFFIYNLDALAQRKYDGGTGEPNNPFQIATAENLILLGETPEDYDKHFILTADIDLDPNLPGGKVFDKAVIAPGYVSGFEVLLFFHGTPFTGIFDGNGHTISHLTVETDYCGGLFGGLGTKGQIRDLGVVDVNVVGSYCVGGLVGFNDEGASVIQCCSTGAVNGNGDIGGLVGINIGNITTSSSTCIVSGTILCVGGLVGNNIGSITTSNCAGPVSGDWCIGGLVGYSQWFSTVTQCYSTSTVSGNREVGGLVGVNLWDSSVIQCYSTGTVSGSYIIGGLVGSNIGTLTCCYSTGSVSGTGNSVGGLVGISSEGNISKSFWDIETSGLSNMCGLNVGDGNDCDDSFGQTTVEMQTESTFTDTGWDFVGETTNGTDDIWWITEGRDYPRLWWERDEAEQAGVIELDDANFDALIDDGVVLVDFFATWCSHCTTQAPILEDVAELVQGRARVAKLDVDKAHAISQRYQVNAIPTLILFRDGLEVQRFVGVTSADILVAAILSAVDS